MKLNVFFSVIGLCFFSQSVRCQTKNEKESRIKLSQFPQQAQTVLHTIPEKAKRIRYYQETDGDKFSFESKFKYQSHWYSVEFSSSGNLEDVEVLVKENQLPDNIKLKLRNYFKQNSEKFDIIKIQEQYKYDNNSSASQFINTLFANRKTSTSNYEVIVAIKSNKNWELREMTFNAQGEFLNTRTLEQDSYEYIMY